MCPVVWKAGPLRGARGGHPGGGRHRPVGGLRRGACGTPREDNWMKAWGRTWEAHRSCVPRTFRTLSPSGRTLLSRQLVRCHRRRAEVLAASRARRVAAVPRRFVKGVHCHGFTAIGTGVPGVKRRGSACRPKRSARASRAAVVAGGRGHRLVSAGGRGAEPGGGGIAAVPGRGARAQHRWFLHAISSRPSPCPGPACTCSP